MARFPYIAFALCDRKHILEHLRITCSDLLKVQTSLPQRQSMVGAGFFVQTVKVLAIVLPETDFTDEVVPALRERHIVAARALMPRRRIRRRVPLWSVALCHRVALYVQSFAEKQSLRGA